MSVQKAELDRVIRRNLPRAERLVSEIYARPEKGFFEFQSTGLFAESLEHLGLHAEKNIARTGCISSIDFGQPGPRIALLAELDAIKCPGHPGEGQEGYAHACGHNLQVGAAFLAAALLREEQDRGTLSGSVAILGVPSEEYIDLSGKEELKNRGAIEYFGGKQELVRKGYFDGVDMALMTHNLPGSSMNGFDVLIGGLGIGFIAKKVTFLGKESHAGTAPDRGINALNAVMLSLGNINALRETFREGKGLRVHSILTEGGEAVNLIPSKCSLEMHIRGKYLKDLHEVNRKINNCLQAGALATGCNVLISESPGYLPSVDYPNINALCGKVCAGILPEEKIGFGSVSGSANDFGDVSQLMTALKIFTGGVEGDLHTRDFRLSDLGMACVLPAKVLFLTIYELLKNGASEARRITGENTIPLAKDTYFTVLEGFSKKISHEYME